MNEHASSFIKVVRNPIKFRMFLLSKLPSAFFSGLRVQGVNEKKCTVSVPYKWFTKNPFRSGYFACLAMAAEMSTGILSMMHIYKREPRVSMLVIKLEANYFKKAVGITTFSCNDGNAISDAVEKAITIGEGQTIITRSTGVNNAGEIVAEFFITWSFKSK
jgi:hypothetical protein